MNLPVQFSTEAMPIVPQQFAAQFQSAAQRMIEGFGSSFNRIKPGTATFELIEGGNKREVQNGHVVGVLLGVASCDHCTWYMKDYVPGQEPDAPDLVWEWRTPDTFPDALPAKYHKKVIINGKERWKFQIARRSVWALVRQDANGQPMLDLDNPYILDMTSMSLYGKGNPQVGAFKYAGLVNFCKSFSSSGSQVIPSMFLTQILLDTAAKLAGVVVFKPMIDNTGRPQYLDAATFDTVLNTMFSQNVQDALKIQEKLTWSAADAKSSATTQAPPAASVAPPQAATPAAAATMQAPVQPVQPVAPQPKPEAMSNDDLMAQAAQVLNDQPMQPVQPVAPQPNTPQVNVAPGVNETTGAAINALAGLFN